MNNMFKLVYLVCFSSVHMEESSVMQGAQGVLVQNWPTASSAAGTSQPSYFHLNNSHAPSEQNYVLAN